MPHHGDGYININVYRYLFVNSIDIIIATSCELATHDEVGDYKVGSPVFKGTRNHEREYPP